VTVGQTSTDAFGQAVFQLLPLHEYQFIVSATNYSTKTGIVNTVITSYVVLINANNTQNFIDYSSDFNYKLTPETIGMNNTIFSITTSSPQGALQWFAVVVRYNGTTYSQNVTGSPSGGTASVTLNFTGLTGIQNVNATYYVRGNSINSPMVMVRTWTLYGNMATSNYTLMDFVTYYGSDTSPIDMTSRGIMVTILAVCLAAAAGMFIGAASAIIVAATVFLFAGMFGWLGIGITIVTVGGLLGLLLMGGRN
jgi:hypothetical protein